MGTSEEQQLRAFITARDAGDEVAARERWNALLVTMYDRISGFTATGFNGRYTRDEYEEARQRALIRFSTKLIGSFAGSSFGELVNATKRLVRFQCLDVIEERTRRPDSLDAGWESGEASDGWQVAPAERKLDDEQIAADLGDFFATAIPELDARKREVVELTFFSALEDAEIAERLGTSTNNVQQLRSRALKTLREKYKEHLDS